MRSERGYQTVEPVPLSPNILTKEQLLAEIADIDSLCIEESDDHGVLLWDDEDAKYIPVRFLENFSPEALAGLIHISSDIPSAYQVDKSALAQYLWSTCDKNAFITLEELVVIWSEPDNPETFEPSGFVDEQSARLYKKYCDEYAYEIGSDVLGQLWFERNTVLVNMGEIIRTAKEIANENKAIPDPYFSFENQVDVGFLTTVLHELRHLQMDTNIFLPEDDYPLCLNSEEAVEEYCREAFESSGPIQDIFPALFEGVQETLSNPLLKREGGCYYHVTLAENVPSIRDNGLIPSIGPRAEEAGETERSIYLFASKDDMDTALMGWLGEWYTEHFGEECKLAILLIRLPDDIYVLDNGTGYEGICNTVIPPEYISFFDESGMPLEAQVRKPSLDGVIQSAQARQMGQAQSGHAEHRDEIEI